MQSIRRTVPFAVRDDASNPAAWLIDSNLIALTGRLPATFLTRLRQSLDLSLVSDCFNASEAEGLIEGQYKCCMSFMFRHPLWALMRTDKGSDALRSYVLETRHYLHAAPWRMAPGPAAAHTDLALSAHLAEHVVEEADHARFFENALATLGCNANVVRGAEPLPGTLEWIFLMRGLSGSSALVAGIASGVMEYTANDRSLINAWHRNLVERKLMPAGAIEAFRKHVDLDAELGHGANWREMLHEQEVLSAKNIARSLNAAATVAESVVRWSDQAVSGLAATAVREMLAAPAGDAVEGTDPILGSRAIWPAEVYHQVAYGASQSEGYRRVVARAYFLAHGGRPGSDVAREAIRFRKRVAVQVGVPRRDDSWIDMLRSWEACIDGHRLWAELEDAPSSSLASGWLLENYHYLAASPTHVAAAIASCPDIAIGTQLVKHLGEEAGHHSMFSAALGTVLPVPLVRLQRPLPSTVAFVTWLADLARSDWKAYVVALVFLQFTLATDRRRHDRFYRRMIRSNPEVAFFANAMASHDREDSRLGHDGDALTLLKSLLTRHDVGRESVSRAARVGVLAWSFLDGIRRHYSGDTGAFVQRVGWTARGL